MGYNDARGCTNCLGTGWVCENHEDKPWKGVTLHETACECGAGAPCLVCAVDLIRASSGVDRVSDQLEEAAERVRAAREYHDEAVALLRSRVIVAIVDRGMAPRTVARLGQVSRRTIRKWTKP